MPSSASSIGIVSVVLALTACSAAVRPSTGTAEGVGNSTVLAPLESDVRFTGSCRVNSVVCRDYWNRPDSDFEVSEHDQCVGLGLRWASVQCTTQDRQGGCKSGVDANGAYLIQWYYDPDYAHDARILCESDGPSEWLP